MWQCAFVVGVLALGMSNAAAAAHLPEYQARLLCAANPAAQPEMLRMGLSEARREDPALKLSDSELVSGATALALTECAERMMRAPDAFDLIQSYQGNDAAWMEAWDAWNNACATERRVAACIKREVAAGLASSQH